MTSKLTFSNIKHTIVKSSSEITDTERISGKLYARSIINRLAPGLQIDVLVLKALPKALPILVTDDNLTVDENDTRRDTRRCYQSLPQTYMEGGKLPVKTRFFKKIKDGDTIIIILHEV